MVSNLEQLEHDIIEQCIEPDGLLVLLRENKFDDEKYQKLLNTLDNYRQLVATEKVMNRKTAGFLRTIEGVFEAAVIYHNRQFNRSEEGWKTQNAHAKIWELMNDIFDVNLED